MRLECDSYYFYPVGDYQMSGKWTQDFGYDIEEIGTAIRIFGTRKQIDKAFNAYCDMSGLNVDEGYDFKDQDKLKEYTKQYKNKALIINIK